MLDEGEIDEVQGFVSALIESKKKKLEEDNEIGERIRD